MTLIERTDSRRSHAELPEPRLRYESPQRHAAHERPNLGGASAAVEAATTIHVTAEGVEAPVHVALLSIGGRKFFAKLEGPPGADQPLEEILAGHKVRVLIKDDGDHYFQLPQGGLDLGRIARALRRRVSAEETEAQAS